MRRASILVVSFDLSNNSVGRAYIMAEVLGRYYDVEILGPASRGVVWEPLAQDSSVKYTIRSPYECFRSLLTTRADAIYAIKPLGTSYGVSLLARSFRHRPLLLDIDDWELGFFLDYQSRRGMLRSARRIRNPNNITSTWLLDKLSRSADHITVSNRFLQRRFGGDLIPHFRDTSQFDPAKFDQELIKTELGLGHRKVVLFLGTPRRHKGISQLADAIGRLSRTDVTLLIVGAAEAQVDRLPKNGFVSVLGQQPFKDIPKFLAAADLVVLFQSGSLSSQGQVPAKVFDAMSMAKPIIASNVSDLPVILDGCGELVEPGDVGSLTHTMGALLDDPVRATDLGRRARERCVAEYSYDAVGPRLRDIVASALQSAGRR